MAETAQLDPASEAVAIQLLRHLEWQPQGFSITFLFADVGPALTLSAWLDARLKLQDAPLQHHEVGERFVSAPEREVDDLIAHLPDYSQKAGALWYGLQRHPADQMWNLARRRFVSRINERRFLLERDLRRPLVLVLPVAARAEVATIAPDLWHIRSASHQLIAERQAQSTMLQVREHPTLPVSTETRQVGTPAFDAWERAIAGAAPEQIFLPASVPAFNELLVAGRPADAMQVVNCAIAIARSRVSVGGTPEALRDLSVSLNNVGEVARAQGDWTQANVVYSESLQIRRQLIERLGGTPEALRDLSVSLDNVGQVARVQGDWLQAEAVYSESLQIRRQLIERLGGTPEALRDLSVSLDNVGRVAMAQGDWPQATAVFGESLQIRRQLIERLGDTPDALRNLSISLDQLGQVAQARGDWPRAAAVYGESLELRRQLMDRLGGTPEALRDWSISLDNVGEVARAQGDWSQAAAVFGESLQISRQLIEWLGGTPEALRDLSVSLNYVGEVARAQGDWPKAKAVFGESLQISRQLIERLGGTPEALDDLAQSLLNVAALPGGDAQAGAEAKAIYDDLCERFPQVQRYREQRGRCSRQEP